MTKLLRTILFFFAFASCLQAQTSNPLWLRVQMGYAVNGNGDRSGLVSQISGGYYFSPRFKAGLGVLGSSFDNGVYLPADENKASVFGLEVNGYFNIVHTKLLKLEIGAGPHVQFWNWNYRAQSGVTIVLGNDILILPDQKVSFDETQLGFNASLGLILTPFKHVGFGLWAVHQSGLLSYNISSVRAGFEFRF